MPKLRSMSEVLDLAIARETESHRFYVELARLVTRPEVRRMIGRLATDELQHKLHLQAVKAGEVALPGDDQVGSLGIEETIHEPVPLPEMSYADLLVIAMKKDKAAFRLYTNLASIATTEALRELLEKLAQQEAEHKLHLELEYDLATF